jgi:hypothetical protein
MTQPDPEAEAALVQGLGDLGRRHGGGRGAAWTAKRLKTVSFAESRRFDPQRGGELVSALALMLGCQPQFRGPDQDTMLRALIGSGTGRMNPTYVRVLVDPTNGSLSIEAFAKEGPIKQRSAAKAVQRILAELGL